MKTKTNIQTKKPTLLLKTGLLNNLLLLLLCFCFFLLKWLFPPAQPRSSLMTRINIVAELIHVGRERVLCIAGQEPDDISLPFTLLWAEWAYCHSLSLQFASEGYPGHFHLERPDQRVALFLEKN